MLKIPHLGDQSLQNINSIVSKLLEEILESEKKLQEPREKLLKWYELHSKRTEKSLITNNKKEKDKEQKDLKIFKIVLLGQSFVVEQFCNKFLTNYFVSDSKLTIGVDFWVKNVNLKEINYKLHIWQFPVKERYRFLIPTYIRGTNGALIMYDIPNAKNLNKIIEDIEIVRKNAGDIPIFLAITELPFKVEEHVDFTERYTFTEITSEIGQNGEHAFELLTKKVLEHEYIE